MSMGVVHERRRMAAAPSCMSMWPLCLELGAESVDLLHRGGQDSQEQQWQDRVRSCNCGCKKSTEPK